MYRRVGADDVEISRTSQVGVYAGAWAAYLATGTADLLADAAGARAVAVLRAGRDRLRLVHERLVSPWRSTFSRGSSSGSRARRRPPGSASASWHWVAVGGPDPRAEQPGGRCDAGHGDAARTRGRDAAEAAMLASGIYDREQLEQIIHLQEKAVKGAGPPARCGGGPDRPGGSRPRGRPRRVVRRARHRRRLELAPNFVAAGLGPQWLDGVASWVGTGGARGRGAVALLHAGDRVADERGSRTPPAGSRLSSAPPSSTRRSAVRPTRRPTCTSCSTARSPCSSASSATASRSSGTTTARCRPSTSSRPSSTRCGPTSSTTPLRRWTVRRAGTARSR